MSDSEQMKQQTAMWCMHLPNHKKKIENMQLVFVNGIVKFVPK
jgi:hypothetical protein